MSDISLASLSHVIVYYHSFSYIFIGLPKELNQSS